MAGTQSGKSAATENFPVASHLIAPAYRPIIQAFYRFARAADDIADHPQLGGVDKLDRLNRLGQGLEGQGDETLALELRTQCLARGISLAHAQDLLVAFRLDVTKSRYADWDDLIAYCEKSAMPVGRFMLDVHGEDRATHAPSDALCAALQVINHLQDCADDFTEIDRVYIPLADLTAEGETPASLCSGRASMAMRRVLDHLLNRTEDLLTRSRALTPLVRDRRLRMEVAVIQAVAEKLVDRLRRCDPLHMRVRLSPLTYAICILRGMWRGGIQGPAKVPASRVETAP